MQTKLLVAKLKEGSKPHVAEILKWTNENLQLAREHCQDKGYYWDSVFFEERQDGDYLIYVVKSENFEKIKRGDAPVPLNEWSKRYVEFKNARWADEPSVVLDNWLAEEGLGFFES